MDPTGAQNRLCGGKRRKDAYPGEEEVVHDNQKVSRRWMPTRGDEGDSKDQLSQVNQGLDFRGMSVDHWMRMQQQQQQQKMEPAAPTTPLNLQPPLNLQQRTMSGAMLDIRTVDSSKQTMLPSTAPQQLAGPQQQLQVSHSHASQQQQQQHASQQLQQHASQPSSSGSGGQVQKFQHLGSEPMQQQQQMPYLDLSSSSRPMSSTLPPLPLSFRPPPIFAESDLRHSPTSSSSNQYPLQNVMPQQQQQRLPPPQSTPLLPDSDDDRYSGMLSNQSSVLQQPPPPPQGLSGVLPGASNSLVLQDLQASAAWYSTMRELEAQPTSSSRLGRASLSTVQNVGQNVSLYPSQSLSDLTCQSGLAPLPYQNCPSGSSFRESPAEQDQLLGDPQSPLPYGVTGSSSSSVVGPKCSASSMLRLNNKPMFQTDFPRRSMLNGQYCSSSSGSDLLNQNMMGNGAGGLPEENCFIQRAPPHQNPPEHTPRTLQAGLQARGYRKSFGCDTLNNYTELRCELARMFNLEGQLDQRSGWQLVFLDNENDILLVGDDPWEEFVTSVRGIRILSPSEVFFFMNEERFGAGV